MYTFEPYYDVIDAFNHIDIPGLNLELRKKYYYRSNMTPTFVSERIIPKNRVNLMEELKKYNLYYYQPYLLLLDSPLYYGGDTLTVKSDKFYTNLVYKDNETNDIYKLIPQTLRKLGLRTSF